MIERADQPGTFYIAKAGACRLEVRGPVGSLSSLVLVPACEGKEVVQKGKEPIELVTGETRSFIEDGDTLTLHGAARGADYTIGFGTCVGKLLPALSDPYARNS